MLRTIISMAFALVLMTSVVAAEPVSFKDKRVTILVGYAPGGGADLTARLVAPNLIKYLTGNPSVIVQNMPGAEGIKALNFFAKQVKPDGLTIYVGSANELDPVRSRSSVAVYNLNSLNFIGGNVRLQSVLEINKLAKVRLLDKSAPPVTMGTVGFPRSSAQMAAWGIGFLGWNAKWITGYKGTTEVAIALERGEVDMISGGTNQDDIPKHLANGNVDVLTVVGRPPPGLPVLPEVAAAPQLVDLLAGKIQDPTAEAAFEYWLTICSVDKWFALPPDTPKEIVEAHRQAFSKLPSDPEFKKGAEMLQLILSDNRHFEEAVDILDKTPQESVNFMASLLRKQGLEVAE